MPDTYDILATIHDEIHLGDFAPVITPRLVDAAQRSDWTGRRVLDLGCGSGISLEWLAQHGYLVTGIDKSAAMLNMARHRTGNNVTLRQQNILDFNQPEDVDLVLSLDTLHELNSLRDFERVFQQVHHILRADKFFIFDVYTIEGLVQRQQSGDTIQHDHDGLLILTRNSYDYERQIQTRQYTIFQRLNNNWERQDTERILRAYPVQAIAALVQRCGYDIVRVFNPALHDYSPGESTNRVLFMVKKSTD